MPVYHATQLPNKIAGCVLWWDANDMATINTGGVIADGTAVTAWKDKINGVLVTGTGTYKTNFLNGKNVISFNGTSGSGDQFSADNVAQYAGANVRSSFIVYKTLDAGDFRNVWYVTKADAVFGSGTWTYLVSAGADHRFKETDAAGTVRYDHITGNSDFTNFHIFSARISGGTNLIKQSDFDKVSQKVTGLGAVGVDVTSTNFMSFGNSRNAGTGAQENNYHKGYIAEAIYFNLYLNDKDYAAVIRYLKNKYAL